ncbi:MAG: hypothetical protein LBE71_02915 [Dysgonamonadaceae bacterium]|jgi:hypothetical protein|nr:hypothetical protein [Dysgonamonadaceae bacterium]
MKKFLSIVIFVILTGNLFCQTYEWESVNAGLASGFSKDKNGFYNPTGGALTLGTAFRCNLKDKQLSPGVQFTFSVWDRISADKSQSYRQVAFVFLVTTDYNYTKIHPNFVPFAGIGVGASLMRDAESIVSEEHSDIIDYVNFKWRPGISPRIGFELFKGLRFTAEYMYLGNGNNFFNYKLGFVIGS